MDCSEKPFSWRTSTIESIRSAVRPVAQVESCGNLWASFSRMAKVSIDALAENGASDPGEVRLDGTPRVREPHAIESVLELRYKPVLPRKDNHEGRDGEGVPEVL